MKIFNNFYQEVISLPNLYRAYETARKGKTGKYAVIEFEENLHENLWNLHCELLAFSYLPRGYNTFYVQDYKKRKIMAPAFRDQVVHHAIFIFLEQMYEPSFIYDSYACRKGKGTHKAFERVKQYARKNNGRGYFMKCDISKYFYSIDHYKLKEIISRKIKDNSVLWLIDKIIDSHFELLISAHVGNPSYLEQRKGMPIGNLTSQLFANIYLNELDYFAKHDLRAKLYVRYVDDFVIFGRSFNELEGLFVKLQDFISDVLMLKLERKKIQINKISFGVDFCGYVTFRGYVRVRTKNYRRFAKKFSEDIILWRKGIITYQVLASSFDSYKGHLLHTNSYTILERISTMFHSAKISLAVKRGGNWNNGAIDGVFCANLNNDPTNTNNNIGFRCCRAPWEDALSSRRHCRAKVHMFLPSSAYKSKMKTRAGIEQQEGAVISKNNVLEHGDSYELPCPAMTFDNYKGELKDE